MSSSDPSHRPIDRNARRRPRGDGAHPPRGAAVGLGRSALRRAAAGCSGGPPLHQARRRSLLRTRSAVAGGRHVVAASAWICANNSGGDQPTRSHHVCICGYGPAPAAARPGSYRLCRLVMGARLRWNARRGTSEGSCLAWSLRDRGSCGYWHVSSCWRACPARATPALLSPCPPSGWPAAPASRTTAPQTPAIELSPPRSRTAACARRRSSRAVTSPWSPKTGSTSPRSGTTRAGSSSRSSTSCLRDSGTRVSLGPRCS